MRRQVPGIILLLLAVWMCALTYLVIRHPNIFLRDEKGGSVQASTTEGLPATSLTDDQTTEATQAPDEETSSKTSILVAARNLKWEEIDKIETQPSFNITEETLATLQAEGLSSDVLDKLRGIHNQKVIGEPAFLKLLESTIGGEQTMQHKSLILQYAEADMLEVVSYPNHLLPDGYIRADELPGVQGQILMVDLNQGDPLLRYQLHRNQARLIEDRTPLNHRAMAVKVDEVIGVAGFIKPYSRVDVLVTLTKRQPPETRTVLRNVLVLAAGPRGDRVESPSWTEDASSSFPNRMVATVVSEQNKGEKQAPTKVNVVTLQVSPPQAEKLALASSEGQLRLVLRNPLDKEPGETQGIDLKAFLAEGKPSKRRAQVKQKVDVYKGTTFETHYVNKK